MMEEYKSIFQPMMDASETRWLNESYAEHLIGESPASKEDQKEHQLLYIMIMLSRFVANVMRAGSAGMKGQTCLEKLWKL